jgi:Ca-activated chloride channel family protein
MLFSAMMNQRLAKTFLLSILSVIVVWAIGFDAPNATVASVGAVASPTPPVEDDDSPIRIQTELVNLNVRVVDRNNRPVNNLKETDFRIFENNTEQKIEFFSKSEVPTNYSLVIDNSGSLRMLLDRVIDASKIIVATNRPDDEASVIRFVSSDKIEVKQDFTSDKDLLNDALDQMFVEGGQTAIVDAVYLAAESVSEYEKSDRERKRRAIILVTDGEDRDSFYKENQLYELLREIDVQIYVVGFISELSSEGGFISKSPQSKAKAFLERLAKETGGKAYFPRVLNELDSIARDISSELRTQYSIGYQPTDANASTFRSIRVTVADGPNREKRIAITRSGIKASSDKTQPPSLQK